MNCESSTDPCQMPAVGRGDEPFRQANGPRRLVLASVSPRRAQLMREHGYVFDLAAPTVDEPAHAGVGVPPAHVAEALSYFKARSVAQPPFDGLVIAADTIAAAGGDVFGKPEDRDDARRILSRLAGAEHEVITGVTVLDALSGRRDIRHDVTRIVMRALSDAEMEEYLDSGEWEGKAGAYGIQDHGDRFVERVEGSFTNVVGLPMELLGRMLSEFDGLPLASSRSG